VEPLLAETVRIAWGAIATMTNWMQRWVRQFPEARFHPTRQRVDAVYLAWMLRSGRCDCGMRRCRAWHDLAQQPSSGLGLWLYVRRAVIGPYGLVANSLTQGMYYLHVLRPEEAMLVADVEMRRCPSCAKVYEGPTCTGGRCKQPYTPDTTAVIAQPRLFIQGVYHPVRRWSCQGAHYYAQDRCREVALDGEDGPRTKLQHSDDGNHDQCPWLDCPNGRPIHPQRGTRLWAWQ
jgi:hypothetical protein